MQIGRFRLGMRTIKSALAVFICMLVFHFFQRGNPLIAALSAVFSLRQDLTSTVSFGRSRIIGNSIGGVLAIIFFFIKHYFHNDFLVELFLLPVLGYHNHRSFRWHRQQFWNHFSHFYFANDFFEYSSR